MKQVLIRKGSIIVDQVPAPLIEKGHVLVEVVYSLISSGTELGNIQSSGKSLINKAMEQPEKIIKLWKYFYNQGIQKTIAKVRGQVGGESPTGYSCSGIVIQVGEGVTDIFPGDKVACSGAGIANHAEIVLVPRNLLVNVPEGCNLKDASSVTLGSIAMQGVRRADIRLGEIVAVIGLGLLGQISVQLLKASGCSVIGVDVDINRVELAKKLGVDYAYLSQEVDIQKTINHLTDYHGVDATIVTAASESNDIVQQAMEITRRKGRVIVVGAVGLGLKRSPFYEKEIDLLISCSYGPGRYDEEYEQKGIDYPFAYVRWTENRNMQEYLKLISKGKIILNSIIDFEYPIDQAQTAYEALKGVEQKPLGIVLTYPLNDSESLDNKLTTKIVFPHKLVNGKINVALIGAGNFAKTMHLPNMQKLNDVYHLRAVVDIMGTNAKITAEKFKADYATTNYEDVLADDSVDMVLITTRHNTHATIAIAAARAEKAIFVEKPMAMNKPELDLLAEVIKEKQVPFMVGYNRRFSPAARRIKEIISDHINPIMIQYRMNAGYLPPNHWTQTEEGGGRIIGEACHIIDLFQFLIGAPVVEVNNMAIIPRTEHVLAGDNMSIMLQYADGSVASLIYTALGSPSFEKEYMELYFDGNVLVMNDFQTLKVYGSSLKGWTGSVPDKGHMEELHKFAKFVLNKHEPLIPMDDLIETANICFLDGGVIL